jgi:hypothetical protein
LTRIDQGQKNRIVGKSTTLRVGFIKRRLPRPVMQMFKYDIIHVMDAVKTGMLKAFENIE